MTFTTAKRDITGGKSWTRTLVGFVVAKLGPDAPTNYLDAELNSQKTSKIAGSHEVRGSIPLGSAKSHQIKSHRLQ
jgi:hypothetical protein